MAPVACPFVCYMFSSLIKRSPSFLWEGPYFNQARKSGVHSRLLSQLVGFWLVAAEGRGGEGGGAAHPVDHMQGRLSQSGGGGGLVHRSMLHVHQTQVTSRCRHGTHARSHTPKDTHLCHMRSRTQKQVDCTAQ